MVPKKGQVWSDRERGRRLAFSMGLILIAMLIAGVYLALTKENWIVIIIAIGSTISVTGFYFRNEHSHRDEP